ncbi:hypothetical protein [Streptomyces sp. NPDC001661]
MTSTTGRAVVAVGRRVEAPAEDIFRILADPGRHPDSGRAWWHTQMESTLERLAELCAAR